MTQRKMLRQPECSVAVTGTNGKSSVVHFLRQIWAEFGFSCASLGTVGLFIKDAKIGSDKIEIPNLTTPGAQEFRRILSFLTDEKVTHFAFEASSHGLHQRRVHSIELRAAAFTNFGFDHLDYHKSKDSYLDAKLILFREVLSDNGVAVVLGDQAEVLDSVLQCCKNVLTFGFGSGNFFQAQNIKTLASGLSFDFVAGGRVVGNVVVNLFGKFQILNVLCASALACACGATAEDVAKTLGNMTALCGRMERVGSYRGGEIYVDYAHTADGFRRVLETFKADCRGKLVCVFGCGGERDKDKRRMMGAAADALADVVIVTDDNPRGEDPASIRREILEACCRGIEIGNRKEAIRHAMDCVEPGDFVVIVGKGHETMQIYGASVVQHNDKDEVLKILSGSG